MKVYIVEDEKYGTQAVFGSEDAAQEFIDSDKLPSGSGTVLEFDVEEQ